MVPPDKKTGRGYKEITSSTYNFIEFYIKFTRIKLKLTVLFKGHVKIFAQEHDLKIHEAPPKSLEGWKVKKKKN